MKVVKTDAEWRDQLDDIQFEVTRKHGTERAWTGKYATNKDPGTYKCICCGQALFDSKTKYESGTGWPSFLRQSQRRQLVPLSTEAFYDADRSTLLQLWRSFGTYI